MMTQKERLSKIFEIHKSFKTVIQMNYDIVTQESRRRVEKYKRSRGKGQHLSFNYQLSESQIIKIKR